MGASHTGAFVQPPQLPGAPPVGAQYNAAAIGQPPQPPGAPPIGAPYHAAAIGQPPLLRGAPPLGVSHTGAIAQPPQLPGAPPIGASNTGAFVQPPQLPGAPPVGAAHTGTFVQPPQLPGAPPVGAAHTGTFVQPPQLPGAPPVGTAHAAALPHRTQLPLTPPTRAAHTTRVEQGVPLSGGFLQDLLGSSLDFDSYLPMDNSYQFSIDNISFHSSVFELSCGQNGTALSEHGVERPAGLHLSSTPVQHVPNHIQVTQNPSALPSPIQNRAKKSRQKSGKKTHEPLDADENVIFEEFLVRKLHNSSDPTSFTAKNGTRTVQFQKIPETYVSMSEASGRTKRRRISLSKSLREKLNSSLPEELCRMPNNQKAEVCKAAGISSSSHVSKEEVLALKTHAELPWNKLRKINQFYSHKGVTHDGEKATRALKQSILGDQLETATMEFEVKDEESPYARNGYIIIKEPCTYVKCLKDAIMLRLDQLNEKKMLTWHNGNLPQDRIWVKFDGDKGGLTTKCGVQIVNVEKPNSTSNHVLVCQFKARDSMHNLEVALNRFVPEIPEINGAKWNDKTLQLFGAGDLDFYYKMLGIAGASGTHPCYMCIIPNSQMQLKKSDRDKDYEKRTLKQIRSHYKRYENDGCPRKRQSEYQNVVNKPILDIEPEDYCPPELHITLGGTKRIDRKYVIDLHGLDFDIGDSLAQFDMPLGNTPFDNYVSVKKFILISEERVLEIEDELEDLLNTDNDGTVTDGEVNEYVTKLHEEKNLLTSRLEKLESKLKLPSKESGPLVDAHEKRLQKHGIKRQRYHGKSFVGNDCQTYLKEEVYTDILESMVEKCKTLTGDPDIIEKAEAIAVKHKGAFATYSKVHNLISHSKYIPPSDLPKIQKAIDSFMDYQRKEFPTSSIPVKYHVLEDHVIKWLERYPFGFGLLGEQGAESIHALVTRLSNNYRGIISGEKQQHLIVEDQHLKCAPHLVGILPGKKGKK